MKIQSSFFRALLVFLMASQLLQLSAAAEANNIVSLKDLDTPPQLRVPVAPVYPASLKRSGKEGSVTVEFIINTEGQVLSAQAIKSTNQEFENSAVEAIMKWRYKPGLKAGRPVATRMQQVLTFQLNNSGEGGVDKTRTVSTVASAGDEPPQPIKRVPPRYPAEMKNAGLIGNVMVEFIIDVNGQVINPIVVASNNPWFERPAIESITQWKFKPGRKNGHPVNTRVQQSLEFDLEGGGDKLWQATKGKDHKNLPVEIRWDQAPEPTASTYPVYPAEALLAKTKGRAVVSFLVNPQGQIQAVRLLEASAPEFGGAGLASLDVWRFKPATREGQPCSAVMRMEFDFNPYGDSSVPVSAGMREIVRELSRKEPRIFPLNKLDARPTPVSRRSPIYPSMLQDLSQVGKAVIEFFIDENGDAQLPRIVSATAPEFGFAAAQALATWRFEVPKKEGKPVIARVQIPITFDLKKKTTAAIEPTTKEIHP